MQQMGDTSAHNDAVSLYIFTFQIFPRPSCLSFKTRMWIRVRSRKVFLLRCLFVIEKKCFTSFPVSSFFPDSVISL